MTSPNDMPADTELREALIEQIGSLTVGGEPHEIRNFLGISSLGVVADFILARDAAVLEDLKNGAYSMGGPDFDEFVYVKEIDRRIAELSTPTDQKEKE